MNKDVKERVIETDAGAVIECKIIDWKPFPEGKKLNLNDPIFAYMPRKQRQKMVDKWRKTHDESAGIGAQLCVQEHEDFKERAEQKILLCAINAAKDYGIPTGRHRVDGVSSSENWDKCGMEKPEVLPITILREAGKHRKEMEKAKEMGDTFAFRRHFEDMEELIREYNEMNKTACFCGIAKFYTGEQFAKDWERKHGV